MISIKSFSVNPLEVNCYVLHDETREAVIIDPGCFEEDEWEAIRKYISGNNLSAKLCLLTHAHFDHMMGCNWVKRDMDILPTVHTDDAPLYNALDRQTRAFLGQFYTPQKPPVIGKCINDGDVISFGNSNLRVIHTPGHSRGCVCYYSASDGILFSGDTLFCYGVGRTDLEGGDINTLVKSLNILAQLPDMTKVYPGHGQSTTIGQEKKCTISIYNR